MSIVSFDDWKTQKQKENILTPGGTIKDEIAQKEEHGFDLCILIAEELSSSENYQSRPDTDGIDLLWQELRTLTASLHKEHAYFFFIAFENFWQGNEEGFEKNFDAFIESKKRLFNALSPCDWWIDNFIWVFNPPYNGFYGVCAQIFFKHFSACAMGWICEALQQSEDVQENIDLELDLLAMAMFADNKCYLAYYLIASIFSDLHYWDSALPYYERAAQSSIYSQDAAFYFEYARAADKAGQNELVINLYQSCLLLDEYYPGAINNIGCSYLKLGNYDDALSCFNKAINLSIDGALPYRNAVVTLEKAERYVECIDFIKKHAIKLGNNYFQVIPLLEARLQKILQCREDPQALKNAKTIDDSQKQNPAFIGAASIESSNAGKPSEQYKSDTVFAKRMFEDAIVNMVKQNKMLFGRKLKIYQDNAGYGRQYFTENSGRIDLLCEDAPRNELCVIHIKNDIADEQALYTLARQIDDALIQICKPFRDFIGIICCRRASQTLKDMVANLADDTTIEIYEFDFSITRV